jgi:hypothetical protein
MGFPLTNGKNHKSLDSRRKFRWSSAGFYKSTDFGFPVTVETVRGSGSEHKYIDYTGILLSASSLL